MLGWGFLCFLVVAGFALAVGLSSVEHERRTLAAVDPGMARALAERVGVRMGELLMPLAALVASTHAVVLDRENGVGEVVRTAARWRPGVPLRRVLVAWAAFLAAIPVVLAVPPLLMGIDLGLGRMILAPLAPAAFLTGLALAVSAWLGSYVTGLAAAGMVWVSDLMRPGVLTGPLYLFQAGQPLADLNLQANRLLLVGAGAVLIALALGLYDRRA